VKVTRNYAEQAPPPVVSVNIEIEAGDVFIIRNALRAYIGGNVASSTSKVTAKALLDDLAGITGFAK
jgi:hypothetical protein